MKSAGERGTDTRRALTYGGIEHEHFTTPSRRSAPARPAALTYWPITAFRDLKKGLNSDPHQSCPPRRLGTYGDDGNALVLRSRARMRGPTPKSCTLTLGRRPRRRHVYTIGGGEAWQVLAVQHLRQDGTLRALATSKPILAICAASNPGPQLPRRRQGGRRFRAYRRHHLPPGQPRHRRTHHGPRTRGWAYRTPDRVQKPPQRHGPGPWCTPLGHRTPRHGQQRRRPDRAPSKTRSSPPTYLARSWHVTPSWRTCC